MAIDLVIGGEPVRLVPALAAMQRAVGCAYLVGGFRMVAHLAEAVAGWKERQQREHDRESLRRASLRNLSDNVRRSIDFDGAMARSAEALGRARAALDEADAVMKLLRRCWSDVAEAEEELLGDYEQHALRQFTVLAERAKATAKAEWTRYAPYLATDPARATVRVEDAARMRPADLRLSRELDSLLKAAFELRRALTDYREAQASVRRHKDRERWQRESNGQDADRALAFARAREEDAVRSFESTRYRVGKQHPVALQVYGRIGDTSQWDERIASAERRRDIETWAIEALLETVTSAPRLIAEAQADAMFKPGIELRRPSQEVSAFGYVGHAELLAITHRLVLPASRAVVVRLLSGSRAARSPWLQYPVRHQLRERALGQSSELGASFEPDAALLPFFQAGRLHHAAVSEVLEGFREERQAQQEKLDRMALAIDAVAIPASFFTGGLLLPVVAGAVHALVRGREMAIDYSEYLAQHDLAGLSYAVIQECAWEHPSLLALAGKLIEGGFDIASDVIVGGKLSVALDAVQTVLAIRFGVNAVQKWATVPEPLEA